MSAPPEAQREALFYILSGQDQPVGTMFQIFSVIIETIKEPVFACIGFDWDLDKRTAKLDVAQVVRAHSEPIRNPVTDDEHRILTVLPNGWVFHEAESASGFAKGIGAIKFDLNRRHSSLANVAWNQKRAPLHLRSVQAEIRPAVTGGDDATRSELLESVLRRDRLLVSAGLVVVIALAWGWILAGAGVGMSPLAMPHEPAMQDMPGMAGMVMRPAAWTLSYALLMFLMWWVAMMLPSATPMLLLFARINRGERVGGRPHVPTGIFAAGYLAAWVVFSALAATAQWGLERLDLLTSTMATTSLLLGAAILIAAGLWQLTPIKTICLRQCRSPISFLSHRWQPGWRGAFVMGPEHGSYCLGCCWFLMALLFFGGIMNLFWIIGLAVFVLLEKTLPLGHWFGRLAGIAAIGWGVALLARVAGGT